MFSQMKKETKEKIIKYNGFDPKIDKAIENAMKKIGYKWYASGYDFQTEIRDLCFKLCPKKQKKKYLK